MSKNMLVDVYGWLSQRSIFCRDLTCYGNNRSCGIGIFGEPNISFLPRHEPLTPTSQVGTNIISSRFPVNKWEYITSISSSSIILIIYILPKLCRTVAVSKTVRELLPLSCSSTLRAMDEQTNATIVSSDTDGDMFTSSNEPITAPDRGIWPSHLQIWAFIALVKLVLVLEWWDPLWLVQLAISDGRCWAYIFAAEVDIIGLQYKTGASQNGGTPKWFVSYFWDLYWYPYLRIEYAHVKVAVERCLCLFHQCFFDIRCRGDRTCLMIENWLLGDSYHIIPMMPMAHATAHATAHGPRHRRLKFPPVWQSQALECLDLTQLRGHISCDPCVGGPWGAGHNNLRWKIATAGKV